MLRKIVERYAKTIKFKLVKQLIIFSREVLFGHDSELVRPLALNIGKVLNCLMQLDQHRDHLVSGEWFKILDVIVRILNGQIEVNMTEKFVLELLITLKTMVSKPLLVFKDLAFDLTRFLTRYFGFLEKESSLTAIILEITNHCIINLSTVNVQYSVKLVKSVTKVIGSMINTNYESLRDQILVFGILANDFICENLPKMIEVESSQEEYHGTEDDELRDNLVFWIDQWLQFIMRNPIDLLSVQSVEFLNSKTGKSWFNFGYIRLAKSSDPKPWLSLLALTNLIHSLYRLEKPLFGNEDEGPLKRRKLINMSYTSIINRCDDPVELFMYFINSPKVLLQKIGFYLLVFYVSNFNSDLASIKFNEVVLYYDRPELSALTSLLAKTLIEHGWKLEVEELSQLLRINLQLIKDKNVVNVACQIIITILSYPNFTITDNSLFLQTQSVFEISEINGPVLLTNDSLKFWIMISQQSKAFKSQSKKVGDRILDWLLIKWDHDTILECSVFPYFISWIAGASFDHNDDETVYQNAFNIFHAKWAQKSSLAKFILRVPVPNLPDVESDLHKQSKIMLSLESITPIADQLISCMDLFDSKSYGGSLMKVVGYSFIIYQNIQQFTILESCAERLKYDIRRYLENLDHDKFNDFNEAVFQITHFKLINQSGDFIFDCFNVQELTSSVLKIHENPNDSMNTDHRRDSDILMSEFGDFGQVRKSSTKPVELEASKTYLDLELYSTMEQKVMDFTIAINSHFSTTKNLNKAVDQAIRLLETFTNSEQFTYALFQLLGYLEEIDVMKIQTVLISKLLRLLGNSLLASYKFERSPTTIILASRLFTVFSKPWLLKVDETWALDYSDMLKWVLDLSEKGLIAEELSLYYFTESIFVNLSYQSDQNFLSTGISLFHKSSNISKIELCHHLNKFLKKLTSSEQLRCFQLISSGFINPQTMDDLAATFTYCMRQLSTVSYPLFITGVSQLLLNYGYLHFTPYVQTSLLSPDLCYGILTKETVLLEFLKIWYEEKASFKNFPSTLFGIEDATEFITTYKHLIYAILVSHKRLPVNKIINNDVMDGLVDETDLLNDTLSLSIPLAYGKHGRRTELLKTFSDTYDDTMIEYQTMLIIKRFLDLGEFTKDSDFIKYIPNLSENQFMMQLFEQPVSDVSKGISLVNISVSFPIVVHQIKHLTSKLKDFWNPACVQFLARTVLESISSFTGPNEKLTCLRKLKLIIIFGSQGFNNQDVMLSVIGFIQQYISEPDIHHEVCRIVVTLLKMYKACATDQNMYYLVMLRVFHEAVKYIINNSSMNHELERFLLDFNSETVFEGIWKMLFVPLVHLLKSDTSALEGLSIMKYNSNINTESSSMEYILINEILSYTSLQKSQKIKRVIFDVLTTFFTELPQFNALQWDLSTDKDVAKLLLESKTTQSSRFELFKARYLGRYYLLTGETLSELEKEIPQTIEYELEPTTSTLFGVFDDLLKTMVETKNVKEAILLNNLFGVVLYEYNRGSLKDSSLVSFDLHLKDLVKTILPLDLFTFQLIHQEKPKDYNWAEITKDSGIEEKSTLIWCRDVLLSLLETFTEAPPIFTALMVYVYQFPEVSQLIIYKVMLFYARSFHTPGAKLVCKFISNILEHENVFNFSKEKLIIVLKLCYFLRIGMEENKNFKAIFQNLNLVKIYKLASHVGLAKFGLMTFELYFTDISLHKSERWTDDTMTLKKIYETLDDSDLLYGLPVDPSLGYAISTMNREPSNGWKSITFNSANIDSTISLQEYSGFDLYASRNMMLQSLVNNSLHGVSELLNDTMEPQKRLKNSYEWYWKLNQWDIPAAESPSTENESIYNALKSAYSGGAGSSQVCERLMISMLGKDLKIPSLLKTLSALHGIETVLSSDSSTCSEEAKHFFENTEKWFPLVPFSEIENIMLSRKAAYGMSSLCGNLSSKDSCLLEIREMKRYGYYARLHGEAQRATNSSMWIDKRVKCEVNSDLKPYLLKISNFESACTLWNQGETAISIAMLKDNLAKKLPPAPLDIVSAQLEVFDSVLNAYLAKWSSESRQERFETIMDTYVQDSLKDLDNVSSSRQKAEVYHIFGYFCYKQTKLPGSQEEIERQEKLLQTKQVEMEELKMIYVNKSAPTDERRTAKRFLERIKTQYEADSEAYQSLISNRDTCIEKALEFFMKAVAIDDSYDDKDVDKICALWLEYSDDDNINKIAKKELAGIPNHKFIPWINQLMSRLSDNKSFFQQILQNVLASICLKHPFHSLYFVTNLKIYNIYSFAQKDATIISRSKAADKLWKILESTSEDFRKNTLGPIELMSKNALALATEKLASTSVRKLNLDHLQIGDFWLNQLPHLKIPLPTINQLKISPDGNYSFVLRILSVDPVIQISASGISLPKILKINLTDGSRHRMLLKGSTDDLRQDAIMEQVFEKVNTILRHDKETRRRDLKMRTYKVIPLGPQGGMIEFVANSTALSDILRQYHKDDSMSFMEARDLMKEVQKKSNKERLNAYMKIAKSTPPVFRQFFRDNFPNIDQWYYSRQVYTRGIATNSIVGHILGLGDRHLNNILIDKRTGEPIHIDLGVAFDQGRLLPIPELVPFRLTRDIVDGLGITGVEGSFKKGSEHVFRVLKSNVENIVGILNVLKYDPLYSWAISPIRKKRLQENENENVSSKINIEGDGSDAVRAVRSVEAKLNANGLSVEASVQELIQEATDAKNLAVIYMGWTPFY